MSEGWAGRTVYRARYGLLFGKGFWAYFSRASSISGCGFWGMGHRSLGWWAVYPPTLRGEAAKDGAPGPPTRTGVCGDLRLPCLRGETWGHPIVGGGRG